MQKGFKVFRQNKRAWYALWLFGIIFALSLFSELIANDKPLIIKFEGKFYFPIISDYSDAFWGGDFPTPADYKDPYIVEKINEKGWMQMPIIPFSFTQSRKISTIFKVSK